MKKIIFLCFSVLLFCSYAKAQVINELFPNPDGDDNNHEFVEIYTEGFMNLSLYILGDEAGNDSLTALQYWNTSYSLIVEEYFNYSNINASVYSVGATIGNNLGNTGDTVFLYDPEKKLLDRVSYDSSFVVEGKSIEKNASGWFVSTQSNGTPGAQNSIEQINTTETNTLLEENQTNEEASSENSEDTEDGGDSSNSEDTEDIDESEESGDGNVVGISTLLDTILYVNQTYTKLFRIDNEQEEKITATLVVTVFLNETLIINQTILFENISRYRTKNTGSLIFSEQGNYTICGSVTANLTEEILDDNLVCTNVSVIDLSTLACDSSLSISMNETHYVNKKQVDFSFEIAENIENKDVPFVITYFIEEANGDVAKEPTNTSSLSKKHWTPKIKKEYAFYTLHASIIETTCFDENINNNEAQASFLVMNQNQEDATLVIDHVYLGTDGIAKTGDIIPIKITVYTGNLSTYAEKERTLRLFIKDNDDKVASETTKVTMDKSFAETTVTLPVVLKYYCSDFPDQEEQWILELQGLSTTQKQKIPIQGINKDRCSQEEQTSEYHSISLPGIAKTTDSVTGNITIHNLDTESHTYKVSSKIYRGPKAYAGDFFENQKTINLHSGEEQKITLSNTYNSLEQGTYKIKIQIQKDQQKTLKEYKAEMQIVGDQITIVEEKQTYPHILSFETLTTELKETTELFTEIEGNGAYIIIIDDMDNRQKRNVSLTGKQLFFFNASLVEGKNNIILTLLENDTVVATKSLVLYANKEELTELAPNATFSEKKSLLTAVTGAVVGQPIISLTESFSKFAAIINYIIILFLLSFNIFLVTQKAQHI